MTKIKDGKAPLTRNRSPDMGQGNLETKGGPRELIVPVRVNERERMELVARIKKEENRK